MGAQKSAYELVSPEDSFIHIDDFASPDDLPKALHSIDDHAYTEKVNKLIS